ncbi:MAG TPA: DMT family transporter [Terriglobia bacterium]|nr:DMT family transporter [Terriglobia bacterium]
MSIRSKAEILLVLVTFFWGATFVIVKQALINASPLVFIAGRFTLAGVALFCALGWRRLERRRLGAALVLGFLLFLGYVFQTWGQEYTTPSKCAFITGFSVVLVPLIMALMGERLRVASVAGAAFGFAGIYFLVSPSGHDPINRGDMLTLVGAVAFAIYIIWVGAYAKRYSFVELAPAQIIVVGFLAYIVLPFDPHRRFNLTVGLAGAIAVTAIFATAFAFAVQNWAQRYIPASHAALIFALEPVFAALTSFWVLNERLGGRVLLGSALVLAGIMVSEEWVGT